MEVASLFKKICRTIDQLKDNKDKYYTDIRVSRVCDYCLDPCPY